MSPDLFNIHDETIFRNIEEYLGLKVNGENINNFRYADDTVFIADSEKDHQLPLDTVNMIESENRSILSTVCKKYRSYDCQPFL